MPTLLCVPILVQEVHLAMADAVAARDAGADVVEFRVDEFFTGMKNGVGGAGDLEVTEVEGIVRLVAECPLPCIVTCRAASEGGAYDGDEIARVALYERLGTANQSRGASAPGASDGEKNPPGTGGVPKAENPARRARPPEHPPRYLDIELAAYRSSANLRQKVHLAVDWPEERREGRSGLILSTHDFNGRPADLMRRMAAMRDEDAARVAKVAYTARSLRDNLELFDLLRENAGGKPTIALGMGKFGLMSRVLAPKFGGYLTFASLRAQSATAPGQPTVREMLDVYRFRSIGARTKVYGVIGWPVEHSLSPLVHNAGFEAIGYDGVYLPLPIAADEKDPAGGGTYLSFKATLEALLEYRALDLSGLSVTMPFKEHLVRWVKEGCGASGFTTDFDQRVWEIGAANTVKVDGAILEVGNTDAMAIQVLLDGALGHLSGKSVAIIGAGGVARAAVWACAARGASVTVYNRTRARAEKMVGELAAARQDGMWGRVVVAEMPELEECAADAVINCTSVGMAGGNDAKGMAAPVEKMQRLPEHAVVMETVYRPVETPLVRAARERGLRVIDGVEMFVEQAAQQFAMWTGKSAPKGLFARVCREALGEKAGGV